jgi:hypothetical protein
MRILNDFDKWLINENNWPKKSHYASNLNGCRRQQYYQWVNEEQSNPNTPGGILKMKFGYAMEDIFRKFLDYSIEKKVPIDGKILNEYATGWKESYEITGLKYPITCKLDFVLFFEDNTKEAVEVKSMFGRGISEIAKKQEAKDSYLDQIFVYIHLTPFKRFNHPYFGRDNGYRTEFEVIEHEKGLEVIYTTLEGKKRSKIYEYNFDKLIDRLKDIEKAVELKMTPDRDFLVAIKNGEIKEMGYQYNKVKYTSDWQCGYCEWRDFCWKNELSKYIDGNNSNEFIKREN